jgi:hypothetical protein
MIITTYQGLPYISFVQTENYDEMYSLCRRAKTSSIEALEKYFGMKIITGSGVWIGFQFDSEEALTLGILKMANWDGKID